MAPTAPTAGNITAIPPKQCRQASLIFSTVSDLTGIDTEKERRGNRRLTVGVLAFACGPSARSQSFRQYYGSCCNGADIAPPATCYAPSAPTTSAPRLIAARSAVLLQSNECDQSRRRSNMICSTSLTLHRNSSVNTIISGPIFPVRGFFFGSNHQVCAARSQAKSTLSLPLE